MAIFKNGEVVDDTYTVQYLIKENSYCETYRVEDFDGEPFFMKLFVINRMPERLLDSDGNVLSICLSSGLSHPNLLSVLEKKTLVHEEDGPCHYIISAYIEGDLLADKLNREGMLPLDEAVRIYKGILEGLQYLHNQEPPLVHNDITPKNIMLMKNGTVELIDLGHLSRCKSAHGVPPFDIEDVDERYLSNETFIYRFDKQTDIFSATAVFYTMLFGACPWNVEPLTGGNRNERYKTVFKARCKLQGLDFSGRELTEKYRGIMRKGLSTNTLNRYKTIEEILEDLEKPDDYQTPVDMPQDIDDTELKEQKQPVPKGFAAIAGMEDLKKILTDRIMFVLKNKKKAEQYRLNPPNGMLLYGPPGCGKTFFAEKFAEECGYNYRLVRLSDISSTLVHGTEENIAKLFHEMEEKAPAIICFDEFDALVPNRSSWQGKYQSGEVNEFLGHLNNCGERGLFVIATSNRPDMIDPAILRTGRIDRLIFVPLPDLEARKEMFRIHLQGRPCEEIDFDALAQQTEGYIASDIAYICNESAMIACLNDKRITLEILNTTIKGQRPSIRPDTIKMYDEIREKMEGLNHNKAIRKIGFV